MLSGGRMDYVAKAVADQMEGKCQPGECVSFFYVGSHHREERERKM